MVSDRVAISSGFIRDFTPEIVRAYLDDILKVASDIPEEYWQLEHFLVPLNLKWELSFCVFFDGAPEAYLIASERRGDIHIHHFMVSSEYRRKGVGAKMLSEIERRAKRQGSNRLTLKVQEDNLLAQAFYLRHGFGILKRGVGEEGKYLLLGKLLVGNRTVAIHQPNYLPWLGYFSKIAKADMFVFLDDVQFTKGGYTNRVKILDAQGPRWITVPVSLHLGDLICEVEVSQGDWVRSHMSILQSCYKNAPRFNEVWNELREIYNGATQRVISELNIYLVGRLCERIGLKKDFRLSSSLGVEGKGDERLVVLMEKVAPGGTYLSGRGGAKYQDPRKFVDAGFGFRYLDFEHPRYDQGREGFQDGLSLLDALFYTGFEGVAGFLKGSNLA